LKKKKRNHNTNRIKSRHTYTIKEIGELLNVHIRTVHSWTKTGLPVLDTDSKPHLIMGIKLKNFLKLRKAGRKRPLKDGEFFCTRCKAARKSLLSEIRAVLTGKSLGKKYSQVTIKGKCESCGNRLSRFSSDRQLEVFKNKVLKSKERENTLTGCKSRSMDADIQGNLDL